MSIGILVKPGGDGGDNNIFILSLKNMYEFVEIDPRHPRIHASRRDKIDYTWKYMQGDDRCAPESVNCNSAWEEWDPNGLWYTLNFAYMKDITVYDNAQYISKDLLPYLGPHLYSIRPKKNNNILQLKTVREYVDIWNKYKIKSNDEYVGEQIDYKRLSQDYDGIEMYYNKDVPDNINFASFSNSNFGCCWNLDAIDIIKLKSYEIYNIVTLPSNDINLFSNLLYPKGYKIMLPHSFNEIYLYKATRYDMIDYVPERKDDLNHQDIVVKRVKNMQSDVIKVKPKLFKHETCYL